MRCWATADLLLAFVLALMTWAPSPSPIHREGVGELSVHAVVPRRQTVSRGITRLTPPEQQLRLAVATTLRRNYV